MTADTPNLRRALLLAGVAAPLVYLATVIAGGWATPGYDHLDAPVSALFESGAPHALPISIAFAAYNLLLVAFGIGLGTAFRDRPPALRLAAAMVALNGLLGLVIELTPMDPTGAPATPAGIAHLVIAALLSLGSMAAMAAAALGWRSMPGHGRAAAGTAAMLALVVVSGALAAVAATRGLPLMGLYQRLTIGTYLAWVLAVAAGTLREPVSR